VSGSKDDKALENKWLHVRKVMNKMDKQNNIVQRPPLRDTTNAYANN